MGTTRPFIALFAGLAMVGAACGSDSGDEPAAPDITTDQVASTTTGNADDPDATAPPEDVELFDSYEGVTADTIKIGAIASDLDELRDLGLVDINQGDVPLVYQTLVDDINANGGVLGRQLELVYADYNPVFNASADEACLELTRDEKVFAILGGIGGPAIDSMLCLIETNPTIVVGGTHLPDQLAKATLPWISPTMAQERRIKGTLALYEEEGLLDGTLATFDDSSEHDSITVASVIPEVEALGHEITTQVTTNIPQGDEVAFAQQIGVFAERLKQDNIDTLIIVQSSIALGVANMRESGYEGTIITIDSGTTLNTIGGFDERDPSTYEGAYGPMALPSDDVYAMEATQECLATFTDANPDIEVIPSNEVPDGEPRWADALIPACRYLEIFTMVAERAGADLNPDTFGQAAAEIGAFELAGQPFNSLAEGKFDIDDGLGIGVFDPTVGLDGGLVPVIEYTNTAE